MKLIQKISNKKFIIATSSTAIFFIGCIIYFAIQTSAQNITVKLENKFVVLPFQIGQTTLLADARENEQTTLVSGIPVRIKIPAIKIDALVENVGLTLEGAVDAPVGSKTLVGGTEDLFRVR